MYLPFPFNPWRTMVFRNIRNRGSYMSAHVLLNLLNELVKRDKMRGLSSILSLFRNKFNKFNNTRTRMLDFFLSYDIKTTLKSHFWRKNVIILSLCTAHCYGRHNVSRKSCKQLVVYRFYCMALFHSQTRRHMINHLYCWLAVSSQLNKFSKFG